MKNKPNKKSQLGLMPLPVKDGMLEVRGYDLIEAIRLSANPASRYKDIFLLRAKKIAKQAKATHLPDNELRGISWFAHVPYFSTNNAHTIFEEENNCFLQAWHRDPDTVLRLVKRIQDGFRLRGGPDLEPHEIALLGSDNYPRKSLDGARQKALDRAKNSREIGLKPSDQISKFAVRLRDKTS